MKRLVGITYGWRCLLGVISLVGMGVRWTSTELSGAVSDVCISQLSVRCGYPHPLTSPKRHLVL